MGPRPGAQPASGSDGQREPREREPRGEGEDGGGAQAFPSRRGRLLREVGGARRGHRPDPPKPRGSGEAGGSAAASPRGAAPGSASSFVLPPASAAPLSLCGAPAAPLPQRGSPRGASPPARQPDSSALPWERKYCRHMTARAALWVWLSLGGEKYRNKGRLSRCSAEIPPGAKCVWVKKRRLSHNRAGVASSGLSAPTREQWKVVLTLSPPAPGPWGTPALGHQEPAAFLPEPGRSHPISPRRAPGTQTRPGWLLGGERATWAASPLSACGDFHSHTWRSCLHPTAFAPRDPSLVLVPREKVSPFPHTASDLRHRARTGI